MVIKPSILILISVNMATFASKVVPFLAVVGGISITFGILDRNRQKNELIETQQHTIQQHEKKIESLKLDCQILRDYRDDYEKKEKEKKKEAQQRYETNKSVAIACIATGAIASTLATYLR